MNHLSYKWELAFAIPDYLTIAFELLNSVKWNVATMIKSGNFRFYKAQEAIFIANSVFLFRLCFGHVEKLLDYEVPTFELVSTLLIPIFSVGWPVGRGATIDDMSRLRDPPTAYCYYIPATDWEAFHFQAGLANESFSGEDFGEVYPSAFHCVFSLV